MNRRMTATTVGYGLLAGALTMTYRLVVWPHVMEPLYLDWIFSAIAVLVSLGLPLLLLLRTAGAGWVRPARLQISARDGRPAFTAPMLAPGFAVLCVLALWIIGSNTRPQTITASVVPIGVLAAAAIAFLIWGATRLTLTAECLTVRFLRVHRLPWADVTGVQRARGWLRLHRRGSSEPVWVALPFVGAEPRFLAAVIEHYATDPAHRAAIGTRQELERLQHLNISVTAQESTSS